MDPLPPVRSRAFFGRRAELAQLDAAIRRARGGAGGLLVVAGESGIGKTRLLAEALIRAPDPGTHVVRVACRQSMEHAFAPLDALAAALGRGSEAAYPSREGRIALTLAGLAAASDLGPVVAILDDAHAAHPDTPSLLATFGDFAARRRIAVLIACVERERCGDAAGAPFAALAGSGGAGLVRLGELPPGEREALFADALAARPGAAPRADTGGFGRSARGAGGNPLALEELARDVLDGEPDRDAFSIRASVRGRLERCAPDVRRVAIAAALCGRDFEGRIVGGAIGGGAPGALAVLARLQLVERSPGEADRWSFRCSAVRDAVLAQASPALASRLHAALAAAIDAERGERASAIEVAEHRYRAGERRNAAAAFGSAADAAVAGADYRLARRWYGRAAVARLALGEPGEADDLRTRAATMWFASGDADRGRAALAEIAADAAARGDRRRSVGARLRLATNLAHDGMRERATAVLRETELAMGPRDAALTARLAVRLASVEATREDVGPLRRALARADGAALAGDPLGSAEHRLVATYLSAREFDVPAWLAAGRAAESRAPADDGAAAVEQAAAATYADQALALGELGLARAHLDRAERLARAIGWASRDAMPSRALAALAAGDREAAAAALAASAAGGVLRARGARCLAALGVALASEDRAALEGALDLPLLAAVQRAQDAPGFASLGCAHAAALAALGRRADALGVALTVLASVRGGFGAVPWMLAVARLDERCARLVRASMAQDSAVSGLPFHAAALALADAELALHAGDAGRRGDGARAAAARFAELGWAQLAARARELVSAP